MIYIYIYSNNKKNIKKLKNEENNEIEDIIEENDLISEEENNLISK